MYTGLHMKYPLYLSDFIETRIFSEDFRKTQNITFHENLPCRSQAVPCGWRTDMGKLIAAFRNFANVPKKFPFCPTQLYLCVLCGSENKQRLFPHTTLTDWFL